MTESKVVDIGEVVVTGAVLFGPDAVPFSDATAYISLLDVSRQDAPSSMITRRVIRNVKYAAGEQIDFSLTGKIDDPRGMYVVSAHIDVDGDGEVSVGDYITTGHFPVSTQGKTADMRVIVQRVTS